MCAWFFTSKAHKTFDCETCSETKERNRNCEGNNPQSGFRFQTAKFEKGHDDSENFINECPLGYITEFTMYMWQKYHDLLFRKELGFINPDPRNLHFESYKIFSQEINICEEVQRIRHDALAIAKAKVKDENAK